MSKRDSYKFSSYSSPAENIHAVHRPFLQRILVWGCITSTGSGLIIIVDGTMTSKNNIQTLESAILPFKELVPLFQQDNAPCHKSKEVTKWFMDNEIEIMDWPARSPDLSPIKKVWATLKRELYKQI